MKIEGSIQATFVENPFIVSLQGVEKRCASCKKRWDDDEKVVVFITSVIKNDTIPLSDESIHIVHLSPCLEEFVSTIMASFPKPEIEAKKQEEIIHKPQDTTLQSVPA
jgi:hypothetical protein